MLYVGYVEVVVSGTQALLRHGGNLAGMVPVLDLLKDIEHLPLLTFTPDQQPCKQQHHR